MRAGRAVAIVATFRAVSAVTTWAAEQIVAAVALGAGTVGDRASIAIGLAAIALRRADTRIANFAPAAIAIVAALGAETRLPSDAAGQTKAAIDLRVRAGNLRRYAAAGAWSDAVVGTALFIHAALGNAGSIGAMRALAAIPVGAAALDGNAFIAAATLMLVALGVTGALGAITAGTVVI